MKTVTELARESGVYANPATASNPAAIVNSEGVICEQIDADLKPGTRLYERGVGEQEPFGYFRPEPFGWTDCAETDEGAIPLYDRPAPSVNAQERPTFDEWTSDHTRDNLHKLKPKAKQERQTLNQCLDADLERISELEAQNAQLLEACKAALSDDQPYIEKCRAAIAAVQSNASTHELNSANSLE